MEYEIEIAEPRKFEFDINLKFSIDGNPHTIRIEDVLGGYVYESYQEVDDEGLFDITIDPDEVLAFTRKPFKVIIRPLEHIDKYSFHTFRTLTLIDSEYSYITLNKLKSKIDTGEDKELELYKFLKSVLIVGFDLLQKHIEKKRVEEQFNKQKD